MSWCKHLRAQVCLVFLSAILSLFGAGFAGAQEQNPSQLPGQTGTPAPAPSPETQATAPAAAPANAQAESPAPSGGIPNPGTVTGNLQFVELRTFSNLTRITGVARERSFLTGGNNNGVDLSYLEDFTRGVNRFEVVSVGRYTEDPRVDPEHNSLQRAYFRITNPHYEVNLGDYLVSYSRFTYNQNLKGAHFIWKAPWGHGFRLLANAGTFTDRYGSLFKEDIFGKPYTRAVSGVRAEQKLSDNKLIALTWAYGDDIVRSLPVDPTTGTQIFSPVLNNVVSLDSRMNFFKIWDMQGELAYSVTNPDTRVDSFNRKDYAVRFDNTFRVGAWNFGEYFTRMMPNFYAVNARQISDLQDAMFKASVKLSSKISLQGTYRRTNNDLREQNPTPRTVFQLPEVRVSFRDLPGLGNTLLDVGYRERHQEQAGLASAVTRAPYFEIGFPISSSVLTFGFEHRAYSDHVTPTNNTSANDATVSFRSIFNMGSWMITPVVRYELNREIFERVNTGNNNRSAIASVILDAPRYFVFEGMYRLVGGTLFQDLPQTNPLTFQPVLGPNGLPLYSVAGPSGFRRPSLHAAITYKLRNNENHTITVSYDRNQNWFALPGQNFFERVMQVTVLWRFRKQG